MRSLSFKLSVIYIFLAILNISIFTIMNFENQSDLITENTKYKTREVANNIYARISTRIQEINRTEPLPSRQEVIDEIVTEFAPFLEEFVLFKETGEILHRSNEELIISEDNQKDAIRAFTNNEFMGQFYFSKIDNEKRVIYFYIPLNTNINNLEEFILMFQLTMEDIDKRLNTLYRMVLVVISVIALFHIIFGFILHRTLITPVKNLARTSFEISKGNFATRVSLQRNDELGDLGNTFNIMAESVESTILKLNLKNDIMHKELQMAAKVQKSIYPVIKNTSLFNICVYHKPLIEVSGDYHNIIDLGNDRYGIIIADVAGHGVSAALITMLIKDQFESLAPKYSDTKELIECINKVFDNLLSDYDKFFTAFYMIIDKERMVTFTNAGHPRTFVIRPGEEDIRELDTMGVFIGLPPMLQQPVNSQTFKLNPGDKLLLYTDGISESLNKKKEEYGSERLQKEALKHKEQSGQVMMEKILSDFNSYCAQDMRKDDETLIIIEIKGEPAGE